ncbi:MAG: N-glycosylase/DNA lyase [Elusimicrobiota bacterium]|nr:N-glycosylase/DNA lyase [Elusimicrobiota bacterium]
MNINKKELNKIKNFYSDIKDDIAARLTEFSGIWKTDSDEGLFGEMVFCLLTPQSRARSCWRAVKNLKDKDMLFRGPPEKITPLLKGVRFKNNKTKYIIMARKQYPKIKNKITSHRDSLKLRSWLAENVCGLGYKESSHFLRNIGLGEDVAILDRHILKNLKLLGVIRSVPANISKKKYFQIEGKMKKFSASCGIPLDCLDLLLWAREAGEIFK